ncbi:hypothetical protein [Vulcanisaeta thermophila]|uniref:hypothetical protein n=1 Tax=Vulcanisaeta thermophila TaxID=867917 RepID=UPI000852B8DD|nr:hypothetical protein [Vulcanisaeta thermophila]
MSKGLSSTVATIILTTTAIALAVAIALWAFHIAGNTSGYFGIRVLIEGPTTTQGSEEFLLVNAGSEYVEISYIEINNEVFSTNTKCPLKPGQTATLTLISNGTYYLGAKLTTNNCTAIYQGTVREYGINNAIIALTNGQVITYENLNLQQ